MKIIKNRSTIIQSINQSIWFLLFVCSILFFSCSDNKPFNQKFIDAYIDLRITEDTLKSGNLQDVKKEILRKHGMTEKQYDETFNYFNKNPELWNDFYDQIIARVDTLRKGGK